MREGGAERPSFRLHEEKQKAFYHPVRNLTPRHLSEILNKVKGPVCKV